jgi:selenocysteine-specific elongation factor
MPLETLRKKLAPRAGAGVVAEALRIAARKGPTDALVLDGDVAKLAGFVEGVGAGGPIDVVKGALRDAALKGMGEHALGEVTALASKELKPILAKVVRDGAAIVAGGQWFDAAAIDALRARVVDHFATHEILAIADFKSLSGLGRKQAIPLLELFDREGVSVRRGDDRAPGPRSRRA